MPYGWLLIVPRFWLLILAGPVLSLTGCAVTSPPPATASATLPSMPSAGTPQPQQKYSKRAQENTSIWRKKLTDTLPTH